MMNDSSFPEVSSKQWKQKIQFELQGGDYNQNLIWKSPEGIDVRPFYHRDDLTAPVCKTENVGSVKGCYEIPAQNAVKANQKIRQIANTKIESIYLVIHNEQIDIVVLFAD